MRWGLVHHVMLLRLAAAFHPAVSLLPARTARRLGSGQARACAAEQELLLPTAEETLALGGRLAELAGAGDVFLLHGTYGSGKTCLARGFLQRWFCGMDTHFTSPSYLIDNCYPDEDGYALQPGVAVHHIDLWRLPEGKARQLLDLPHIFSDCVSLIEWPQRLGDDMPAQRLDIHLRIAEDRPLDDAPEPADALEDDNVNEQQPRRARLVAHNSTSWQRRLMQLEDVEQPRQ